MRKMPFALYSPLLFAINTLQTMGDGIEKDIKAIPISKSLAQFLPVNQALTNVKEIEEYEFYQCHALFWAMPVTPPPPCNLVKTMLISAGNIYAQLSEQEGSIKNIKLFQGGSETTYHANRIIKRLPDGRSLILEKKLTDKQLKFIWELIKLNTLPQKSQRSNKRTLSLLYYGSMIGYFDQSDQRALRLFIGGCASRLGTYMDKKITQSLCALL